MLKLAENVQGQWKSSFVGFVDSPAANGYIDLDLQNPLFTCINVCIYIYISTEGSHLFSILCLFARGYVNIGSM
jgi:hypothetical protein